MIFYHTPFCCLVRVFFFIYAVLLLSLIARVSLHFNNDQRILSLDSVPKKEMHASLHKLSPRCSFLHSSRDQLTHLIVSFYYDCKYFGSCSMTGLISVLWSLGVQCSLDYPCSFLLASAFEATYGTRIFSLLHLPPTEFPSVAEVDLAMLPYNDLFSEMFTFFTMDRNNFSDPFFSDKFKVGESRGLGRQPPPPRYGSSPSPRHCTCFARS
ncbi:hypothetical protein JB92DRAFT_795793 [Gautieria morchelliformis]|nr:hypothetical protein JB92DRAFT_795793 [Gautieria morchelliformis]